MEEFFANVKMEKYTHLTECDVKEYDKVELLSKNRNMHWRGYIKVRMAVYYSLMRLRENGKSYSIT